MAPPPRTREPAGGWRVWLAPLLPLACVALGGATARWSEGLLLLALGAWLVAAPPRAWAGWGMQVVLGGLALLALAAYLPSNWFPAATWRTGLVDDLAVQLAWTHTPQPWVTAENLVLFAAGLAWFYATWTRPWNGPDARRAAQVFAGGAAVLAAVFVGLYQLHIVVPLWPTERHFGPFPNRNQTADFLAVGSLAVLGCGRWQWRAGRKAAALAWAAGWGVMAWGVFLSFSRAGVAILILGTAAYVTVEMVRTLRRNARPGDSGRAALVRRTALALTVALALCSGFLLLGGDTLERFRPSSAAALSTMSTDFRLRIQRDAIDLVNASPVAGVGLGNFGSVFPFYRQRSALPARAIHPESDYLWLAGELGWGALLLALAGLAMIARRTWPPRSEPERAVRAAAALAVAAFALHGLVDVSGHRIGTVFSAIFLMGVALRPSATIRRAAGSPAWLFQGLGAAFIAVGGVWMAAGTRLLPAWPGLQGVERLKAGASQAAGRRDFSQATRNVDLALDWAPLDWTLYFARASADLGLGRDPDAVAADFRRARYLEPYLAEAPITEARLWAIGGQYGLAVNALAEACRREPDNIESYVGVVFAAARSGADKPFHDEMATLARTNPAVELPFYEQIEPPESIGRIADAVAADPGLTRFGNNESQRRRFFRIWAQRGDIQALAAAMIARPAWQKLGWRWWAEARARAGAEQEACEIAGRFSVAAKLPPVSPRKPEDLLAAAAVAPDDPSLALQLYVARDAVTSAVALRATRRITMKPGCPRYFHWIDAQLSGETGEWRHAWEEWQRYLEE